MYIYCVFGRKVYIECSLGSPPSAAPLTRKPPPTKIRFEEKNFAIFFFKMNDNTADHETNKFFFSLHFSIRLRSTIFIKGCFKLDL